MTTAVFKTGLGWIGLATTMRGVSTVVLPKPTRQAVERALRGEGTQSADAEIHLRAARAALSAYLEGTRRSFDLPLDLEGQTAFRTKVWAVLQTIPYGRVRSYGWVARKVGRPRAARAVGAACGANPVPLLVPCHRVVASDGSLGGFSGGLPTKKQLLRLEGIRLDR